MSGRSYEKKEVIQWGYAALVCIALGFATVTGASANTNAAEVRPTFSETRNGEACLLPAKSGDQTDKQSCGISAAASNDANHDLSQILNSALVNTSLELNKKISPLRDDRAY